MPRNSKERKSIFLSSRAWWGLSGGILFLLYGFFDSESVLIVIISGLVIISSILYLIYFYANGPKNKEEGIRKTKIK
jgi:uncharacterized membrane protein HdeD (DUF308 family)